MSYRIVYEKKKHPWEHPKRFKAGLLAAVLICAVLVAFGFLGMEKLQFLLPGDPAVTAAALENMADSLQNGQEFSDAVLTFCREVLQNAAVSQ